MTSLFAIENLTVLEMSELVKAAEEQFGVRAAKAAKKAAKKAAHKAARLSQSQIWDSWAEDIEFSVQEKVSKEAYEALRGEVTAECTSTEDILREIVLAQIASDGGKCIERFAFFDPDTWNEGYDVKDVHILNAIWGIESNPGCEIKWFIDTDWEVYEHEFFPEWNDEPYWEKQMDSIIYFEWNGYQISFHSFTTLWKKVDAAFGSESTEWDHLSSADTCAEMILEISDYDPGYVYAQLELDSRNMEVLEPFRLVPGDFARSVLNVPISRQYYLAEVKNYEYENTYFICKYLGLDGYWYTA